jgi:hypothetical protein
MNLFKTEAPPLTGVTAEASSIAATNALLLPVIASPEDVALELIENAPKPRARRKAMGTVEQPVDGAEFALRILEKEQAVNPSARKCSYDVIPMLLM